MTTARPAPLDDRSLMRDVQAGSPSALAALYERTVLVLYPLALRITGAADRACSVMEELFDEVWRDRGALRPAQGIPLAGMIRRCRELALAQVKAEVVVATKRPMTAETPAATDLPATGNGGGIGAEKRSFDAEDLGPSVSRQVACDALEALPEQDRMALEEAYFRGASARDIAMMVGTPTSDAESMLRSALVRFRNHIDSPDGLDSIHGIEAGTGTEG